MGVEVNFQPSLLDVGAADIDESYSTVERTRLDPSSWVDYAPGWVAGSDALFTQLLDALDWGQRTRKLYDRTVQEPRLTSLWRKSSGEPLEPALVDAMRLSLSKRYGVELDSVGFNLYRDGGDSVAWHGDHIAKEIAEPIVALVSVGEPRRFLLRPKGGGRTTRFLLGRGDLLVTGGRTQRNWEHSVPKVTNAGPRISIAFRHGLEMKSYRSPPGPDEG